jgi:hypothetical protein
MSNRFRLIVLSLAVVLVYGIAIPFIMSDEFDKIGLWILGY